jgi:hypothetical protein
MLDAPVSADHVRKLCEELSILSKQQLTSSQSAAFIRMSTRETLEYDERRIRVSEIYSLLGKYKAPGLAHWALISTSPKHKK